MAIFTHLRKAWKLKGDFEVKFDGSNFFFKFSCDEDKTKILYSDPIFIRGQVFAISSWQPGFGPIQEQVNYVPIWVNFYNLPRIAWTMVGIKRLANHLGKLLCFNEATEK